jgi:hypothetical protein
VAQAPLFDAYLMVDWSAAAVPRRGADSIWLYALHRDGSTVGPENPPTRGAAAERLLDLLAAGRATLAGFDFPLGYPQGTAAALGLAGPPWRAFWELIAEQLIDRADNSNNRFDLAARLNRRITGTAAPFWGCPRGGTRQFLGATAPRHDWAVPRRLAEQRVRGPQPVWKLYGNGSVGSQALTGIPIVHRLRSALEQSAVWPFETGLRPPVTRQTVFAEIYPSLVPPTPAPGEPKDAGQLRAIAAHFARSDAAGGLARLFAGDPTLSAAERAAVEREEGWILGVTAATSRPPASASRRRPLPRRGKTQRARTGP